MKRAVAGLVLGVWAQAGWCALATGNKLLDYCRAPENSAIGGSCTGYVVSAVDTHEAWVDWNEIEPYFCTPAGVTGRQLAQVVVKYLNENPEKLHLSAGSLVLNALGTAFPCP
jgi:hypothetical protein